MKRAFRGAFVSLAAVIVVACGGGSSSTSEPAHPMSATKTTSQAEEKMTGVYAFDEKSIDGEPVKLDRYKGKVLLIVNVASRCGFTPQYEGLEALYQKHETEGLVLLGFPCDQFGNQEPGTEAEIKTFCATKYSVTFPLFSKIEVNGPNANPLYSYMRKQQPGSFSKDVPGADKLYAHLEKTQPDILNTDSVKWNFTKFLVDRKGNVVKRFESMDTPQAIEPEVVAQLAIK